MSQLLHYHHVSFASDLLSVVDRVAILSCIFPNLVVDVGQSKDHDHGYDARHERVDNPAIARRGAESGPAENIAQESNGDGVLPLLEAAYRSGGHDVGSLYGVALLEDIRDLRLGLVLALQARARDGAGIDDVDLHFLRVHLELLHQGVG